VSLFEGIGLLRANTNTASFDAGVIDFNTVNAYANLFYPYILDNGGNYRNVSLTIDILNKSDLQDETKDFANKNWVNKNRLENNLSSAKAIWGFKEAFHGVKKSRSISNAFCFGGQKITFYIAPQGHGTGYVDEQWVYCKTSITIAATDVLNGTNVNIKTFSDFDIDADNTSRYFSWAVPSINQDAFDQYGLFGLCVLKIDIVQSYYSDSKRENPLESIPFKNQAYLQLLIYSGAKEIIEVNAGDLSILNITPSYTDTLEQIFSKTIFDSIQDTNKNPLTDKQKRAIVADQIAVLFMSQHPVVTADFYPGKIIGSGGENAVSPRKVVEKAIIYGKRYPDIIPMVNDRLFGMVANYKAFNFVTDIESYIPINNQSSQIIRDPVRAIYIDSDGIINSDFGIDGISFDPYAVNVSAAEIILDVPDDSPIDMVLHDELVDIQNITITDESGGAIEPYDNIVKVGFETVYGDEYIQNIRYSIFSKESSNYGTYLDSNVSSRSHIFTLDGSLIPRPAKRGDFVSAQIDIEDVSGSTYSFIKNEVFSGYTSYPYLYNLKIYQRNDGSKVVDIYYTYDGLGEINNSYLYIQFSIDGGITWSTVPTSSLKGDFGYGIISGRHRVTWLPEVDLDSLDIDDPILCRLTMYDADNSLAEGYTLTGALVMDISKPDVAVMILPSTSNYNKNIVGESEIYSISNMTSLVDIEYTGGINTAATVVIDGYSFVIGNIGYYLAWDIGGSNEHVFSYEGESLYQVVGGNSYYIVYNGTSSLLFSIKFNGEISSSSSSSYIENWSSSSTSTSSNSSRSTSSSSSLSSSSSVSISSSSLSSSSSSSSYIELWSSSSSGSNSSLSYSSWSTESSSSSSSSSSGSSSSSSSSSYIEEWSSSSSYSSSLSLSSYIELWSSSSSSSISACCDSPSCDGDATACFSFSNWNFSGTMNPTNSDNCTLYFDIYGIMEQEMFIYKDAARTEQVASGISSGSGSPETIYLNESNGSGLNGVVDWDGTIRTSGTMYLSC